MKIIKLIVIVAILAFIFTSCGEDDPVAPVEAVVSEATVNPVIGGANEPNQLYFNFSSNTETAIQRDSWDLRFYSGDEFRVSLNTSLSMATKQLDFTDLNAVTTATVSNLFDVVKTKTFDAANMEFIDDVDGDINNTAIAAISDVLTENKVYLLNLGYEVATETPEIGSVISDGAHRGWKKIRIIKQSGKYLLQYAALDDTTYQEKEISKKENFNFTFFSFNSNAIVDVEPEKIKWDVCFTVFTNEYVTATGISYGSYVYSDFIVSNNLQNVKAYSVSTDDFAFADFVKADIVTSDFLTTQRAIGSSWRIGGGPGASPAIKTDRFYILKDTENRTYKVRFLLLTNSDGERGNPQFEYTLLD